MGKGAKIIIAQHQKGHKFYHVRIDGEAIGDVYFRGGTWGYWVAQRGKAFLGCHYSRKEAAGELLRTWRQVTNVR